MKKLKFKLDPTTGTLSENDSKKYFSTVGFAVFALVVISYASSFLGMMLLGKIAPQLINEPLVMNILAVVCQYAIALPVCAYILSRLPKDTAPTEKMGVGGWVGGLCVAFCFMSVGNWFAQITVSVFESLLGVQLLNPVAESAVGTHWVINLLFVGIAMPIIEELVFRKLICDRLLPLGEGYTVLLSAVIFGLVHGNFYQFFYAFLLGGLFSLIYVKTGRVRYTILYHIIINISGGVFLPALYEKLSPMLTDENMRSFYERAKAVLETGDQELMAAFIEAERGFMIPFYLLMGYETVFFLLSFVGVILVGRGLRRIKLRAGLLPPQKEGRVANILCNVGVAAAITAFVGQFILSVL